MLLFRRYNDNNEENQSVLVYPRGSKSTRLFKTPSSSRILRFILKHMRGTFNMPTTSKSKLEPCSLRSVKPVLKGTLHAILAESETLLQTR